MSTALGSGWIPWWPALHCATAIPPWYKKGKRHGPDAIATCNRTSACLGVTYRSNEKMPTGQVKVLHGYRTLLWVNNARKALEREHNRLVAQTFAIELVDDILEYMLEGWYFGESGSGSG